MASSKIEQALKDGYQAIAQQFGLYRLLDHYQALLVEHKPHLWQSDYAQVEKIKRGIEHGTYSTEGWTNGGILKNLDINSIEILQTSPAKLFEPTGDGQ